MSTLFVKSTLPCEEPIKCQHQAPYTLDGVGHDVPVLARYTENAS